MHCLTRAMTEMGFNHKELRMNPKVIKKITLGCDLFHLSFRLGHHSAANVWEAGRSDERLDGRDFLYSVEENFEIQKEGLLLASSLIK